MPYALVALAVLVLLVGCRVRQPDVVFDPTHVGVVESVDVPQGAETEIQLAQGELLVIDFAGGATANDVPGTPREGELLLYVADVGGKPWVLALSGQADCFMVRGRAIDTGEALVFESGLRLPKADDYDAGGLPGPPTEYTWDQSRFCVNAQGIITHYAG